MDLKVPEEEAPWWVWAAVSKTGSHSGSRITSFFPLGWLPLDLCNSVQLPVAMCDPWWTWIIVSLTKIPIFAVCVCVYLCTCIYVWWMFVYVSVWVFPCMDIGGWMLEVRFKCSFPVSLQLSFGNWVSHWTLSSRVQLDYLASIPQIAAPFCLPITGVSDMHPCNQRFTLLLGSKLRISCLHSKHFTYWAISLAPRTQFWLYCISIIKFIFQQPHAGSYPVETLKVLSLLWMWFF